MQIELEKFTGQQYVLLATLCSYCFD